ncbi:MAG TPA: HAD hydrolase family protein [Candidatus Kapabacteria bacterium]|nr:HAD hydrolase family protein [Candidatus Kapabacteria bacterium]
MHQHTSPEVPISSLQAHFSETIGAELKARIRELKLLVLDVDGTLTDGGIYLGPNGEEYKRFDVHDGHGIVMLQKLHNVEVMFLSGRSSAPVEQRARELGIKTCLQGHFDKNAILMREIETREVMGEHVAAMGDDLGDLAMMEVASLGFAPMNAIEEVKRRADYITQKSGGNGAVREICDLIIWAKAT